MTLDLPNGVHLRTTSVHALPEEAPNWLSDEERARCATYGNPERRASFVAGRWAVRTLLHEITGLAPQHIALQVHPDGWVFAPDAPEFALSISHTAHLAVAGVAPSRIGVDVERADRTMSPALHRYLLHPEDRVPEAPEQFMALWTIKEAVLKAMLTGLRVRPNTLCVEGAADREWVRVHASDGQVWTVRSTLWENAYLSVALPEESGIPS